MAAHCAAIVELQKGGAIAFDYGNNLRAMAERGGLQNAFAYPGFVVEYIRPMFSEGRGPFRWVALSGSETDIRRTDRLVLELFPKDPILARWVPVARGRG